MDLNSSIMELGTSDPFSLARAFCSDPRWSMAAAAITPRLLETAFIPASFPGVSFTVSSCLFEISDKNFVAIKGQIRAAKAHIRSIRVELSNCTKYTGYAPPSLGAASLPERQPLQHAPLFCDQRFHALSGKVHHFLELRLVEGVLFGGCLDFHNLARAGHDEVEVDFGLRVFFIREVEENRPFDNAHADRRHKVANRRRGESSCIHQFLHGQPQRHESSRNGSRAGAAIGLNDVAIESNGSLAQLLEIDHSTQRASDQALDLVRASALPSPRSFARSTGQRRSRQHAVFGGDPAFTRALQERGHGFIDGSRANHPRVSNLNQGGALSGRDEIGRDVHGPHLLGGAVVGTENPVFVIFQCRSTRYFQSRIPGTGRRAGGTFLPNRWRSSAGSQCCPGRSFSRAAGQLWRL